MANPEGTVQQVSAIPAVGNISCVLLASRKSQAVVDNVRVQGLGFAWLGRLIWRGVGQKEGKHLYTHRLSQLVAAAR